uniref:Roadblock/LAMTOR2 domain-containing protein n=1 Tax=Romanomermis culicivorax TaxID=13658 RepID=A0A915KXV5_ROMCU
HHNSQAHVNLTKSIFCRLITKEGTLLAYAGNSDIKANITAAMASNLFQCYEKNGQESFREEKLRFLILDCENGILAVTKVANLYLCMHAKETTPTGMIKLK